MEKRHFTRPNVLEKYRSNLKNKSIFAPFFHLTRRKKSVLFFINSLIFNKGLRKKSVYGRDDVFLWIFLL